MNSAGKFNTGSEFVNEKFPEELALKPAQKIELISMKKIQESSASKK